MDQVWLPIKNKIKLMDPFDRLAQLKLESYVFWGA